MADELHGPAQRALRVTWLDDGIRASVPTSRSPGWSLGIAVPFVLWMLAGSVFAILDIGLLLLGFNALQLTVPAPTAVHYLVFFIVLLGLRRPTRHAIEVVRGELHWGSGWRSRTISLARVADVLCDGGALFVRPSDGSPAWELGPHDSVDPEHLQWLAAQVRSVIPAAKHAQQLQAPAREALEHARRRATEA